MFTDKNVTRYIVCICLIENMFCSDMFPSLFLRVKKERMLSSCDSMRPLVDVLQQPSDWAFPLKAFSSNKLFQFQCIHLVCCGRFSSKYM